VIVVLSGSAPEAQISSTIQRLADLGYQSEILVSSEKTLLSATTTGEQDDYSAAEQLRALAWVEDIHIEGRPFKLVGLAPGRMRSKVNVGGVYIGGSDLVVMAGPCTVESEEQVMETARAVARAGAKILRGGAYKPSTSPYSFQGLGEEGLEFLKEAGCRYGLKVVTEVMDVRKVELVCQYADMLQIGTRNMQNYDLLKEVGQCRTPVLLKRGMTAKLEEWLLAAEYIAAGGNEQIVLCERGIRSFDTYTRNTLDLAAVPALRSLTHLPVVVDPSQGTGRRDLVSAMSKAAVAAGADGLLIEVHPHPDRALKDGAQSINPEEFASLMPQLQAVSAAIRS
jgi:3-deoxy-7-phosphoheptulonate synthase